MIPSSKRQKTYGLVSRGVVLAASMTVLLGAPMVSAQLNCNPGIEFYEEGPIKQCNLNGNHRLYTVRGDVVICADGNPLVQFPDGRLRSCTVAEPSVIGGERCDAPARIEIAPDGALRSCDRT